MEAHEHRLHSSRAIEGYASLTSVNRGGRIKLFVNTASPTLHAGYLSHGVLRRPGSAADDEYRDASRQSAGDPVTRSRHRPGRVQLARSLRARHPQRRRSDGVDERHLPREADRKRRTQAAVHRLYGAGRWPALGSDHGADREHVSGLQRVGREIALRHDREPERHRTQSRQGVIRPSVLQ